MPSLPPDVIRLLVDHLHDDKPSLKACSLVSKLWYPISRNRLFHNISLTAAKNGTYDHFALFLISAPHVAHCIRGLTLTERVDHWVVDDEAEENQGERGENDQEQEEQEEQEEEQDVQEERGNENENENEPEDEEVNEDEGEREEQEAKLSWPILTEILTRLPYLLDLRLECLTFLPSEAPPPGPTDPSPPLRHFDLRSLTLTGIGSDEMDEVEDMWKLFSLFGRIEKLAIPYLQYEAYERPCSCMRGYDAGLRSGYAKMKERYAKYLQEPPLQLRVSTLTASYTILMVPLILQGSPSIQEGTLQEIQFGAQATADHLELALGCLLKENGPHLRYLGLDVTGTIIDDGPVQTSTWQRLHVSSCNRLEKLFINLGISVGEGDIRTYLNANIVDLFTHFPPMPHLRDLIFECMVYDHNSPILEDPHNWDRVKGVLGRCESLVEIKFIFRDATYYRFNTLPRWDLSTLYQEEVKNGLGVYFGIVNLLDGEPRDPDFKPDDLVREPNIHGH